MTLKDYEWITNTSISSKFILIILCVVLIWVLVYFLLKEYKNQQQIVQVREQLRQYALEAEDKAIVDECNRISKRIHDLIAHVLTAQSIQLNNAIAFWQSDPDKAYGFLTESKKLVDKTLEQTRYSIAILRSDPLGAKDLKTAISLLLQKFSQRTKIIPRYITSNFDYPFSDRIKTNIYRIVQEALTNIAEHSEATEVTVKLQTFPQCLEVSIADNGKGFNLEHNTTGIGIREMRERVIALRGSLIISSSVSQGCILTINIPYQHFGQSEHFCT